MKCPVVRIDARTIADRDTFHDVFASAFGFPDYYGRNMDAWIDCMSSLDDPDDEVSSVNVEPRGVLTLQLDGMAELKQRCPGMYNALIECSAFVNWRRTSAGEAPLLVLSFNI